LLYN
jgi:hypothetical protein